MVYLNATCVILNGFVSDFIGDTWSDLNWFFQYTHSNQSNSIRFDWDWKISLQVNESTLDLPRTDAVGGPIRAGIYASPPPIRQITAKASLTHMAPCPIKLNWIKLNSHQIHQQSQLITMVVITIHSQRWSITLIVINQLTCLMFISHWSLIDLDHFQGMDRFHLLAWSQ